MKHLNSILQIKKHRFDDLFEEANYKITLKFSFFLFIALIFLYITQFISFDYNRSNLILFAILFSFIFYFYTLKTGEYKKPALIGSYTYALIIEIALYTIPKNPPIIEGLWMINNIFFTFRCASKKHGYLLSLVHFVSLSIFYFQFTSYNTENLFFSQLSFYDKIGIVFNILFAFLVFLFFIQQTIETNAKASQKIKLINQEIYHQFEIINKQNEEKTILLKEIHHRVKNNLQIIISLLRLQSYQIENSETIQSFKEAINRILAISSIHEKIYQNESFNKINIKEYFNDLSKEIISMHDLNTDIETNFNFEIDSITIDTIVPLALIFNELISNSIKHFDNKTNSLIINIEFKSIKENKLQLNYSDNGKWVENNKKNTLGIDLINALTKQINGKMILNKFPTTEFNFEFDSDH
ncbi:MAG: sensor histidine kinase [Crocinitomicaceae bacterium]|jgi:two-component sensor histidine kinase